MFASTSDNLVFSYQNLKNIFVSKSAAEQHVLVIGSPILDGRVDRNFLAEKLLSAPDVQALIPEIDGEFLIILWNEKKSELSIVTDRYSSYPAFWAMNANEFCFSYNYTDIARHCSKWGGFKLRPEKAYEFFVLQRLMGTDTHDNQTQSIPPATIMTVMAKHSPQLKTYWQPNYTKDTQSSEKDLVHRFSDLFGKSVRTRSGNDDQKTGIFLSGGHDSRLVAAYADKKTACYTLSFKDNLEVNVAKKLADVCGHDHIFSKIDADFFEQNLSVSSDLSGALYTTDHALFLGAGMNPLPRADVFLHGHGLDFMYQGMYLHAEYYKMFGRNTTIKHFVPMPDNMPDHFIKAIPFRLKYDLSPQLKHRDYDESLQEAVRGVYDKAKGIADAPMDQLEYMIFHNPSRHYTFSNVLSKRTCGELRTPSFDNELYDFYLSLPFKYRLHASMMRGAMYKINPKIANMPVANHSLPAGWGPYSKTAALLGRKLLRHATLNRYFHGPSGKDRTWPDRDTYFKDHPSYRALALAPLRDGAFKEFLSFIDWEHLEGMQDELETQPLYGAFLVTLLSYYSFYKSLES